VVVGLKEKTLAVARLEEEERLETLRAEVGDRASVE
jgi:hypothetical protein